MSPSSIHPPSPPPHPFTFYKEIQKRDLQRRERSIEKSENMRDRERSADGGRWLARTDLQRRERGLI